MNIKALGIAAQKAAPGILNGLGIAGVIITAWNCKDDTIKAVRLLDSMEEKPEGTIEKIKATWKCYIPTGISMIFTIACIGASGYLSYKKQAALAAALALIQKNSAEFELKSKEILGSEKVREIKKKIVDEKLEKKKKRENIKSNIIELYEPWTDQVIYITPERLAWAVLEANRRLHRDFQVTLADLIKLLGGKPVKGADEMGWNFENEIQDYNWGYFGGVPWIEIITSWDEELNRATLYYEVGPESQKPEDLIWVGQDKYYAGT